VLKNKPFFGPTNLTEMPKTGLFLYVLEPEEKVASSEKACEKKFLKTRLRKSTKTIEKSLFSALRAPRYTEPRDAPCRRNHQEHTRILLLFKKGPKKRTLGNVCLLQNGNIPDAFWQSWQAG